MEKLIRFNEILKNLRKENNLTQAKLAELLNVSETTVRYWEIKDRRPSYDILYRLSQIFDVTVGQLLGVEDL